MNGLLSNIVVWTSDLLVALLIVGLFVAFLAESPSEEEMLHELHLRALERENKKVSK